MYGPPSQAGGIRDPFAWKEALTPQGSARNSRAGSAAGSNASTPRNPPTPPLSPAPGSGVGSARSSRSNLSGRSGGSGRYTPTPAEAFVCGAGPYPDLSARTSNFYSPEPSVRSSEFGSLYDSSSVGSARLAELGNYEGLTFSQPLDKREAFGRKQKAVMAAAFDAFVQTPPKPPPPPPLPTGMHKEVEAALEAGFNPDYSDSFGNSLFHIACQNGNKRIAKLAIKYGGDMDAQNLKGNTGIHFLYAYGYADIAEYFISKGADDSIANETGKTPREGIR
eukprot:symbB.v1.2.007869.t1/scaffold448.1/size203282/21